VVALNFALRNSITKLGRRKRHLFDSQAGRKVVLPSKTRAQLVQLCVITGRYLL